MKNKYFVTIKDLCIDDYFSITLFCNFDDINKQLHYLFGDDILIISLHHLDLYESEEI